MKVTAIKSLTAISLTAILILGGCVSHTQSHTIGKEQHIETLPLTASSSDTTASDKYGRDENRDLYEELESGFQGEYIVINSYTMKIGYSNVEEMILTRMRYVQKAEKIKELLPIATEAVYQRAREIYKDSTVLTSEDIEYPTWQYLSATMKYADSEEYLLYNIMNLRINVEQNENTVSVNITAKPSHIRDFARARSDEAENADKANTYLNICYTFAYFSALYDEKGEYSQLPYVLPTPDPTETQPVVAEESQPTATYYNFEESYKQQLVYPLEIVPNFRDTWGQGRSNNTRQHTGTDMSNPGGSNIYSCSNGTVLYKGYDSIPGNYVIILDDHGFEYHYYHLVEIPPEVSRGDRVRAGDLIAHVGDTGNSDVNHLHITIIDKNGVFINPYGLMRELADKKD